MDRRAWQATVHGATKESDLVTKQCGLTEMVSGEICTCYYHQVDLCSTVIGQIQSRTQVLESRKVH